MIIKEICSKEITSASGRVYVVAMVREQDCMIVEKETGKVLIHYAGTIDEDDCNMLAINTLEKIYG